MRYFFHISYNGADYRGWQRQPNAASVQESIENCLDKLLKKQHHIMGCGRTDAQVHASQFFFHLDLDITPDANFLFALNKMLPPSISIHQTFRVEENNHAQHSAVARTYDYFFHTNHNPFIGNLSTYYDLKHLNTELINKGLQIIREHNDFAAFCLSPAKHSSTNCKISEASYYHSTLMPELFRFRFKADHFLRGMIRIFVGKLLLLGKEELSVHDFKRILASGAQPALLNQAYPQGLYLSQIHYPFLDCPPVVNPFNINEDAVWLKLSEN